MSNYQPSARIGSTKTLSITVGTSTTHAATFSAQTRQVRLAANVACHVRFMDTSSTTASTSDAFLPANWSEYITVTPGQYFAGISAATAGLVTGTPGTLWVTEIA